MTEGNVAGSLLQDLLQATKGQRKEIADALRQQGSSAAMGVLAAGCRYKPSTSQDALSLDQQENSRVFPEME